MKTERYRLTLVAGSMTPWYRDCENYEALLPFLRELEKSEDGWNALWENTTTEFWTRRNDSGDITHTVEILDRETTFDTVRLSLFWLDVIEDLKNGTAVLVPSEGSWKVKNGKLKEIHKKDS